MTISSQVRTAGPFTGNGIVGSFPFTFKVFNASDVVVVQTVAGVDSTLVLNTDYRVALNADQNAAPGGSLVSQVLGVDTPLTTGYIWNATSNVSNLQPVNLTNNGGFFPRVINDALDRATILIQQLVRGVNASMQFPLSDGTGISNILPNKAARLGKIFVFDAVTGAPAVSTQTIAQIEAGASVATAQAIIATQQAVIATTQAGIATTQQGIATAAAGTATAQAALALGYSNIALNAAGYAFTFSTNVAASDPGAGGIKFNNATLASATACYISETSALAQGIAAIIATWDDSTSTIRSRMRMVKATDVTVFADFNITGTLTDSGTWDTLTVAYVGGNGTFLNGDTVFVQNARTGDQGVNGNGIVAGGTAGGTANALTFTPSPAVGSYTTGMTLTGIINATNTGSPTVNVSGVAATSTRKSIGGALVALVAGDLQAGVTVTFVYDGTFWILQGARAYSQGADIASAGTINFDTSTGDYFNVTGTTGITAITLQQGRQVTAKFAGILTITNGASLVNVSAANITTAAGDVAVFRGEASGVVRMVSYQRASGQALISTSANGGGSVPGATGSDIALTNASNRVQDVSFTAAGLRVVLPDATTLSGAGGPVFIIRNVGTIYTAIVTDNAGQPRAILLPGEGAMFYLSDISTAKGTWAVGVGGGAGALSEIIHRTDSKGATCPSGATGSGPLCTARLTDTTFMCLYIDFTATMAAKAVVMTITGNDTLSAGSAVTLQALASMAITSICAISATAVFCCYGGTSQTNSMVLTVSGTTITTNSQVSIIAATVTNLHCFAISTTAVYVGYSVAGNRGVIMSLSGATITANSITSGATNANAQGLTSITQIDVNTYAYFYAGASSFYCRQVFTVSGVTVTAQTAQTGLSGAALTGVKAVFVGNNICVSFRLESTNGMIAEIAKYNGSTSFTLSQMLNLAGQASDNANAVLRGIAAFGNYIWLELTEQPNIYVRHLYKVDVENGNMIFLYKQSTLGNLGTYSPGAFPQMGFIAPGKFAMDGLNISNAAFVSVVSAIY